MRKICLMMRKVMRLVMLKVMRLVMRKTLAGEEQKVYPPSLMLRTVM